MKQIEDKIISSEELKQMFKKGEILDTDDGWYYKNNEIEIIAIHDKEIKYVTDMLHSKNYKIRTK